MGPDSKVTVIADQGCQINVLDRLNRCYLPSRSAKSALTQLNGSGHAAVYRAVTTIVKAAHTPVR
jgi:hypothetical protein